MKTDEARWKEKVKALFKERGQDVYYHMPVQNGMGAPSLDFIGCMEGIYFAVETKDSHKDLTERQEITKDRIIAAGGTVFRVRCTEELEMLRTWLFTVRPATGHYFSNNPE